MKIYLIHQFFSPFFANDRTYDLAYFWYEQGFQVHVITSFAYCPVDHTFPFPVYCIEVPYQNEMNPFNRIQSFFSFMQKANRILEQLSAPDLMYVTILPLPILWLGKKWKNRWKVPYVLEITDPWPDVPLEMMQIFSFFPIGGIIKRIVKPLYHIPDLLLPYSPSLKTLLHERYQVPIEKMVVSYNGTNLTQLPFDKPFRKDGPLRALYAGTVGPANGLNQWIYALNRLPKKERLFIDIFGWGKELNKIKEMVKRNGLTQWVTFHPPVPKQELYDLAEKYDIGIVSFAPYPILETNSAGKFYDYMAMGLPVVLNYEGWQGEFIQKYQIGFSVPQRNTEALVRLLNQLQKMDREKLYSMGIRARQIAEKFFDRRKIASEVTQHLLDLLRYQKA